MQTSLFWINYLGYVLSCEQLYHIKTTLTAFFLTHAKSPKIIDFDIIFSLSEYPHLFDTEKMVLLNPILEMLPMIFCTHDQ